jgi:hypothetical protein
VCLVGYFGGLRNIELRSIEFGRTFSGGEKSFEMNESGFWFSFERAKQRGLPGVSTFCVPRRQADWTPTVSTSDRSPIDYDPASVIDLYLDLLEVDLKWTRDEMTGGFFKSAHGKGARLFRNVPMGKNLIEKVGREMAEQLFLPNPATYTSHCWRRSCGTNSSDAGVNVTTLMSHLGWTTPKTAIGYVQKSRMTSFNMAMFLSNCQRQNKDLDQVFSLLKNFISQQQGPSDAVQSKEGVAQKKGKKSSSDSKPVNVRNPDFDEKEAFQFSRQLAASRKPDSGKSREMQKVEAENLSVVDAINESFFADHSRADDGEDIVGRLGKEEVGGGGGVVGGEIVQPITAVAGGSGGGDTSDVNFELDPRVASILSNLRNHGQIHVHFHFAK